MDSDDSNISDHVGDLDIQSYQFEQLCNDESQQEREHLSYRVQIYIRHASVGMRVNM
jgi:hypothetical protein